MSKLALYDIPRCTIVYDPCPCARCSPYEPIVPAGGWTATVPARRSSANGMIVCMPCAALLLLEMDEREPACPTPPEVAAGIRAAAPPEAA